MTLLYVQAMSRDTVVYFLGQRNLKATIDNEKFIPTASDFFPIQFDNDSDAAMFKLAWEADTFTLEDMWHFIKLAMQPQSNNPYLQQQMAMQQAQYRGMIGGITLGPGLLGY